MLDRDRILSKIAELEGYLRELDSIRPASRAATLHRMKGFRNVLVHEYGDVDDDLVFLFLTTRTGDFLLFRREILEALAAHA